MILNLNSNYLRTNSSLTGWQWWVCYISVTNSVGPWTNEVEEYLHKPVENVKDPLKWWVANHHVYPNLHHMALDYLSILGKFLLIISIPHLVTYIPPDSYINCCWTCILTGPPTFVLYLQLPKCFIYSYTSLSWFLGLPWSHYVWGCACICERKVQEEAGRCWYRCEGSWVINL